MTESVLAALRIVLVEPAGALNVGAIARVMKNMGVHHLVLVNPKCDRLGEEARLMAVHAADVLEGATVVKTLPEALRGCQRAIATTARPRVATVLEPPRTALPWLLEAAPQGRGALIFGPEDRGLSNEELNYAQRFVAIPSDPAYAALNLAQAVAICCYELYQWERGQQEVEERQRVEGRKQQAEGAGETEEAEGARGAEERQRAEGGGQKAEQPTSQEAFLPTTNNQPLTTSPTQNSKLSSLSAQSATQNSKLSLTPLHPTPYSPPASLDVLEGYYQQLEEVLLAIGYLHPHTAASRMQKFRRLFNRAFPSTEEVAMLRGILSQVRWATQAATQTAKQGKTEAKGAHDPGAIAEG